MKTNSFSHDDDRSESITEQVVEKDHLKSTDLHDTTIQKANFSFPKCTACKDEVEFSEGDVIYGDKWYHNGCWKEIQSMADVISE